MPHWTFTCTLYLCVSHSQDDIDDSDDVESVDDETEGESDDEDDDYEFEGENGNVLNRSNDSEDSTSGFII